MTFTKLCLKLECSFQSSLPSASVRFLAQWNPLTVDVLCHLRALCSEGQGGRPETERNVEKGNSVIAVSEWGSHLGGGGFDHVLVCVPDRRRGAWKRTPRTSFYCRFPAFSSSSSLPVQVNGVTANYVSEASDLRACIELRNDEW